MRGTTYKTATALVLAALERAGWTVSPHLKVPTAKAPDGTALWFKAQSVHTGNRRPEISLWLDLKKLSGFADRPEVLAAFLQERARFFMGGSR